MKPQQSIAHYRITSKIGEGGMGAVYRATDTKLNREVAVKVLPESFASDPDRLARFAREAQVLAALNHPNIATVHGVEERALVMELVPGPTLAERIAQGAIPLEEALPIAKQIIEALEYAHERGIIHRDLKPANIKITPEGRVKVLDFGLAKALGDEPAPGDPASSPTLTMRATVAGTIIGTAAYMSPEQARGRTLDRRADIWAFGAVLYEMLSGFMLFGGRDTVTDTIAAVVKEEPDWNALPADLPPHIRKLLERCLRKDLKKRMQAIGDVRLLLDEPDEAPAPSLAASGARPERRWLPWLITALSLSTGAAAIWLRPKAVEFGTTRFTLTMPEGYTEGGYRGAPQAVPSPDGRLVAFVARDKAQKESLWVRPLGSLVAQKLDKTEGANYVFWSPDGQFIGFFADGKLKRIAVSGGSPQTLCDAAGSGVAAAVSGMFSSGDGATWSREGIIVFSTIGSKGLMRVPATGGIPTQVTTLAPDELAHNWPQFLPDGRRLLYLARGKDPGQGAIYIQELGSAQRTLVMKNILRAAWSPPGYLLFMRESTLLAQRMNLRTYQLEGEAVPVAEEVSANEGNGRAAFAVSENGVLAYRGGALEQNHKLAWYDRQGKRLAPIGAAGHYVALNLSPDEKSAALASGTGPGRTDTWIMNLATGVLTRATMDSQSSIFIGPWSPDSQRIAINKMTGAPAEVAVTAGKARLLATDMRVASAWSPDGNALLGLDQEGHRLFLTSLTGDTGTRAILETPYHWRRFCFSPNGRWVSYASDESGRFEVFVASFPSFAEKRQISSDGGGASFWRRDGRELLYVSADGTVMSAAIRTDSAIEVGTPKPLFQVPRVSFPDLSVAPTADAQRFLVIEAEQVEQQPQFTIVVNWLAELKR